jgi:uncharacterized damage-inducible protein DinB
VNRHSASLDDFTTLTGMHYTFHGIPDDAIPRAKVQLVQHALDTYASETNKVGSVWSRFRDADLPYRPQDGASTVAEILRHQLLSERRFFGEFLGLPEVPAAEVIPNPFTVDVGIARLLELSRPRLEYLAARDDAWWLAEVGFFDVHRSRIWVFWRRVLHTAHHRTQLTVYLRMLGRPVPATYGPSADEKWVGADSTTSVEAASRR